MVSTSYAMVSQVQNINWSTKKISQFLCVACNAYGHPTGCHGALLGAHVGESEAAGTQKRERGKSRLSPRFPLISWPLRGMDRGQYRMGCNQRILLFSFVNIFIDLDDYLTLNGNFSLYQLFAYLYCVCYSIEFQ